MVKRFFRDSAWYAVPTAVNQGLAFVLFPLLTRALTPSEYGVADVLTVVGLLVGVTLALEVSQGLGRYQVEAADPAERRRYTSTALFFTAGVYLAGAALAFAAAAPVSEMLLGPDRTGTLRIAVVAFAVAGVLYLVQDQLRWQLKSRAFVIVAVTNGTIAIAVTATLILGFDSGPEGFFVGQAAGAVVGIVLALALSRGTYAWVFDRERLRQMLSYSLPLVPSGVGVFLATWADRLVIKHWEDLAAVGAYGVAFRISAVVLLIMTTVKAAFMPLVLSRLEDPQTRVEIARIFRLFVLLALSVTIVLATFSEHLVALFAPESYDAAIAVVPLLVPAVFLTGMWLFAPGLSIAKRTKTLATITVATGAANVALAYALVPAIGISGAALATLLTAAAGLAAQMRFSQSLFRVPHRWPLIALATVTAAGVVCAGYWGVPALTDDELTRIALRAALSAVGVGVLAAQLAAAEVRVAFATVSRVRAR